MKCLFVRAFVLNLNLAQMMSDKTASGMVTVVLDAALDG